MRLPRCFPGFPKCPHLPRSLLPFLASQGSLSLCCYLQVEIWVALCLGLLRGLSLLCRSFSLKEAQQVVQTCSNTQLLARKLLLEHPGIRMLTQRFGDVTTVATDTLASPLRTTAKDKTSCSTPASTCFQAPGCVLAGAGQHNLCTAPLSCCTGMHAVRLLMTRGALQRRQPVSNLPGGTRYHSSLSSCGR